MYTVEQKKDEIIVRGPNSFEKSLPPSGIGVVLRLDWAGDPTRFAVEFSRMTDEELVGQALQIPSYPHQ